LLRAIRWAVEERNVSAATQLLAQLPQGAARRTLALRLKLRVARLAQDNQMALETARLLAKHRAFSPQAARSMVRGLVLAALSDTHDAAQVQAAWAALDSQDRRDPDVVVAVVQRMRDVADAQDGGAALALARQWVLPVWEGYPGLGVSHQVALVRLLPLLGMAGEVPWLARIENMQREHPADPLLQYLAAEVFFQQRLWGKAAHLFQQASRGLGDARLRGAAWCRLAELAEERGDTVAALAAWRQAASGLSPLA
jgi:HemY protein